jgi:hypothetical protein
MLPRKSQISPSMFRRLLTSWTKNTLFSLLLKVANRWAFRFNRAWIQLRQKENRSSGCPTVSIKVNGEALQFRPLRFGQQMPMVLPVLIFNDRFVPWTLPWLLEFNPFRVAIIFRPHTMDVTMAIGIQNLRFCS